MHPNEVSAAYSKLIPLLRFQVSIWGLNLVTQYFDSLSVKLQVALHVDPPSERTSLRYAHVELGKKVMYTGYDPVLPINRLLSHLRHTHNLVLNGVT